MESVFKTTRRNFTIATMLVAILCAVCSGAAVYFAAQDRLDNKISVERLQELSRNHSEVNAYIESQSAYGAHFESIATIIQEEEQRQIKQVLPWTIAWVSGLSAIIGWFLAQRLLRPVREAYVAQRRFLQDAAHELRNPLAAMRSMIQSAQHGKDAQQKPLLTALDKQTAHLSSITSDLLLLEHKETAGRSKHDLVPLLQDVIEGLHHVALEKKITVKLQAPAAVVAAITPQHFVHMTHNVIENAIKFSKPKGVVTVQLTGARGHWNLRVKDQGIGIPKQELTAVTQRFYRASNTTDIAGTGLGLAIVHKFVDLYGGKVSLASTKNRGTTVVISI